MEPPRLTPRPEVEVFLSESALSRDTDDAEGAEAEGDDTGGATAVTDGAPRLTPRPDVDGDGDETAGVDGVSRKNDDEPDWEEEGAPPRLTPRPEDDGDEPNELVGLDRGDDEGDGDEGEDERDELELDDELAAKTGTCPQTNVMLRASIARRAR